MIQWVIFLERSRRMSNRKRVKRRPTKSRQGTLRRPAPKRSVPRRRKKRYRLAKRARLVLLVLSLLLLFGVVSCTKSVFFSNSETAQTERTSSETSAKNSESASFENKILADSAILLNANTGEVVFEKGADEERKPASLVKLMTVYTALDLSGNRLNDRVAVPEAAFLDLGEAAISGLEPNELVTIKDLLYAAILPSGGDAAQALALISDSSIDDFVSKMNENAENLGMKHTAYTNVVGLDETKQVTTARDISRLMQKVVNDDRFLEIVSSDHYTTSASAEHAGGKLIFHTLKSHMNEYLKSNAIEGYEILGGKTGYTLEAGICLASVARNEKGDTYIAVTMHAGGDLDNYYPAIKDAVTLYNLAFKK